MTSASFLRGFRRCLAVLLLGSFFNWSTWLFVAHRGSLHRRGVLIRAEGSASLEDIQQMRAKEIKKELVDQGVDVSDIFDKEDLVERLWQLRSGLIQGSPEAPTAEAPEAPAAPAAPEAPAESQGATAGDFMARCRGMKVKELRTELGQRDIPWADALDKDELVERLAQVLAKEAAFCSSGRLKPGIVSKITGKELEEELADSTTPLLLDVYATWCGPCKVMEPHLQAAAKKLGNQIRVAKMDSDEEGDASTNLRVNGLPTLILFDRSGKQVQRNEGAMMESQIIEMVQAANLS